MLPLIPLSACFRASPINFRDRKILKSTAIITIINGPPVNSASANCQPIRTIRMTLSSATRLVEASSNAIAAVKSAPFRKIERANATAAYEHDDDAAPSPVAIARDLGESFGSSRLISPLETTAWTTPESPKPKISGHKISQNIANAIHRACPKAFINSVIVQDRISAGLVKQSDEN